MEKSQSQRRKRPITACIECVRRKQRCDRQKPCNGCVARGVEDRCVFPPGLNHSHEPRAEPHEVADLAASLGFSPQNKMSTTLHNLHQSPGSRTSSHSTSGSNKSYQASCSLSRYHIIVSQIPSETVVDELINVFFAEAGWYFCLVDRPYYDELFGLWSACHATTASPESDTNPSESFVLANAKTTFVRHVLEIRYFPALLFQMLALALHFLPASCPTKKTLNLTNLSSTNKLSKSWSDQGHEIMAVLGRIGSPLTAVLADMLRCTWLKNSGLGGQAWHVLSDAVRQAQYLGLHEKTVVDRADSVEDTLRNMWHDEHRRRVWISVFAWDAHMALSLDRPRLIIVGDCTAEAPLDCDLPVEPFKVVPTAAGVAGKPSRYTSQLFKYSTGLLIHEAMSTGALRSPCKDHSKIATMHQRINDLTERLPTIYHEEISGTAPGTIYRDISKQKQQTFMIAHSLIMSLHRPHVMHRAISRSIAVSAALDSLKASQSLFELCAEQHFKIHTVLFYTIDAVIFLSSMVAAHSKPEIDASGAHYQDLPYYSIRNAVYQAVKRVGAMRTRSDVAREAEKALRKCCELVSAHEHEYSALTGTSLIEETSPSTLETSWTPSSDQDFSTEAMAASITSTNVDKYHDTTMSLTTSQDPHLPESIDLTSFGDMSDFLYNPEVINNASYTSAWMEKHNLIDDLLLPFETTNAQSFYDLL